MVGLEGRAPTDLDALVLAAQEGQPAAMRALYDDLAPRVSGYLRTRGVVDVEDLVSEVFLAVLPRIATVTGEYAGLRTLLFSVAHARLVDSVRSRARRPELVPYEPASDQRQTRSAEEQAEETLGSERAMALLAGLPESQREVIALRVLADLSIEETAAVLATTEGAVKQLQRRGLIALRALVAVEGVTL